MAKFQYTARDKTGKAYKGTIDAPDKPALRAKLKEKGFFVTKIKKLRSRKKGGLSGKIKPQEIVVFTERLSVMINAGLSIIRSLQTIGDQTENEALKKVIEEVRADLEAGIPLSQALGKHPEVFSNLYINLAKAGETGGVIDEVLAKMAEYLNKEQALRQSLIKAFSYPVIVGFVAMMIVGFLVIFIVPVFAQTYEKMGLRLPLPTLALMALSHVVVRFWWAVLIAVFSIGFGFRAFKASSQGRLAIDKFKLKLPIFGELNRKVIVSRFISTFGLLISSGITVMQALGVLREITGNKVMEHIIDRIRQKTKTGSRLIDSFSTEELFPPMAVQMIAAGEESGKLSTMLKKTSEFLERDIDNMVQKLVVRLEPLLTFALALVIGFIALAIYLPMFDVISSIGKK